MFLHGSGGNFWTLEDSTPLLAVRIFSIVLGIVVLWSAYKLALVLFPGNNFIAGTAVLLMAGWPQFVYMSRAINNDSLATAVAVLILIIMLRKVGNPRRYIWAAALSIIAILSKITVTFTVGAILGGWIIEALLFKKKRRQYLLTLGFCLVMWTSTLFLIYRHPILNQYIQQDQVFPSIIPERAQILSYWQDVFLMTLSSGWARFGWMDISPPSWHAYLWWFLFGVLFTLGFVSFIKIAGTTTLRWQTLFIFLWFVGVSISFIRVNISVFQPQFRFAWSILPVLTVFAAKGWDAISCQHERWQSLSYISLYIFFFLYNLWTIQTILGEVYTYG